MTGLDETDGLNARAAEYVIGTLPGDDRAAFAARLATDEAARAAVAAWERRLSPLQSTGAEVPPPTDLWSRLEQAIGVSSRDRFRIIDGGARPSSAILRSRDRWRASALSMAGIAAALVAFVVVREVRDARLPDAATYVAAVNRGGDKPALIVTVDLKTRQVVLRPIAAQAPAGHSLELWYIDRGRSPRSVGLVTEAASRAVIPAGADVDGGATFAISVEPPGGSKTGSPTGAVLYSGQLVKE